MKLFRIEPVVFLAVIDAAATLAVAFGAPLTADQKVAVLGFGGTLLTMLFALWGRSMVSPVAKTEEQK